MIFTQPSLLVWYGVSAPSAHLRDLASVSACGLARCTLAGPRSLCPGQQWQVRLRIEVGRLGIQARLIEAVPLPNLAGAVMVIN
jgi:hypothetical protein